MDNLKEVLDALELAERIEELKDYAVKERESVWRSMLDMDNGMTPDNRRMCTKAYARRDLLVKVLEDIIDPVGHQGSDKIRNLYEDLMRDIRNAW